MEPLNFENLISEKPTTLLNLTHFIRSSSVGKLFRIVEIFLGLVFLSWTSTRLPFAVKISGEYFRHLITVVISPLFIFLLSNLIVLTLLFKAGDQSPAIISSETETETEADFYEELVKASGNCMMNFTNLTSSPDEIKYEDKRTIFEVSRAVKIGNSGASEVSETVTDRPSETKSYSRSQSENSDWKREFLEEEDEDNRGKLRRSETEKCGKVANPGENPGETVYIFDELSNEEFQQTIEAFIARQIKFHREEKLAVVLHRHT